MAAGPQNIPEMTSKSKLMSVSGICEAIKEGTFYSGTGLGQKTMPEVQLVGGVPEESQSLVTPHDIQVRSPSPGLLRRYMTQAHILQSKKKPTQLICFNETTKPLNAATSAGGTRGGKYREAQVRGQHWWQINIQVWHLFCCFVQLWRMILTPEYRPSAHKTRTK